MPTGKITALRVQERDKQRVNVFIDEAFALGVSLTTLTREGLFVGKELDEAAWTRLEAAESSDKALQAALRFLELRPRSLAEVRERLRRKGYGPEAIEAALTRLSETGLLDDQAFSRFWVEARQNSRPRGKLALRSELLRKGIDRATINETLAEQGDANDERERAEALARSVLHKYNRGTDKHSFQRRLGGFLQRRGFAPDIVIGLVGQLWREIQTNAEEE